MKTVISINVISHQIIELNSTYPGTLFLEFNKRITLTLKFINQQKFYIYYNITKKQNLQNHFILLLSKPMIDLKCICESH